MARKAKPPPSTLVFSAAEWVPLTEAFARAKSALGSSYLAEGNLVEHFRSGQLPTARYRGRAFVCVEPTFWKSLRAEEDDRQTGHPSILVSGLPDELTSAAGFFVARAALGKLYSTDPTPSGALPEASDPQRRRGRIVVYDWHTICGEIARRCLDSSGRVAVPENESQLADDVLVWCEIELGRQPAASAMREAVRKVCSALRKGPPPPKKRSR